LWRIVTPHFAKASAAETVSVATVGSNGTLIPSALRLVPTGQTTTGNPFANKTISGAQISTRESFKILKGKIPLTH
jgi:hypothetical protein